MAVKKKKEETELPLKTEDNFQMTFASFMPREEKSYARSSREGRYDSKIGKYDFIPTENSSFHSTVNGVDVKELIELTRSAFKLFQNFYNSVMTQVMLCNTKLHIRGTDKKVVKFFEAWLTKIQIWPLANAFFLEWFRSGNVFLLRIEEDIPLNSIKSIFAKTDQSRHRRYGIKYILLDPAQMVCQGSSNFAESRFVKILTNFEIEKLKVDKTHY